MGFCNDDAPPECVNNFLPAHPSYPDFKSYGAALAYKELAEQPNAGNVLSNMGKAILITLGVGAAVAMTRKLLPALSRSAASGEIEALIRDCLGRLHNEPKIVIRLHGSMVDSFRERLEAMANDAGFSGRVVVVAEARIGPADARIEWADGGVERNTEQVWQEIEAIIERFAASGAK